MKRKEICEKTDLTPKVLRLYEEKGLIRPDMGYPGHYHTRDYSQDDLRRLEMIAMLRRALFTLEELRQARQSAIEGVEFGDAFYSAEKECIYVAVNTEFLGMPEQRYYLFYR